MSFNRAHVLMVQAHPRKIGPQLEASKAIPWIYAVLKIVLKNTFLPRLPQLTAEEYASYCRGHWELKRTAPLLSVSKSAIVAVIGTPFSPRGTGPIALRGWSPMDPKFWRETSFLTNLLVGNSKIIFLEFCRSRQSQRSEAQIDRQKTLGDSAEA